jgi:DNA-binding MarR family transcriptional regulator
MKNASKQRPQEVSSAVATYDLDQQIGFRLRLAMQRHTDIFFRNMVFGLTQPQFATLSRLLAAGPCSQNHLGRSIALDSASMVGVISRLKTRKLVSITKDRQDRRRIVIDLTAAGRAMVRKAILKGIEANELTLAPLSIEERKMLIYLLKRITPSEDATNELDRLSLAPSSSSEH